MSPKVYFVNLCYNKKEMLPYTIGKMLQKFDTLLKKGRISNKSKIVFVYDGRKDNT